MLRRFIVVSISMTMISAKTRRSASKEKIERVFADAKEKHAMRYTQYRELTSVVSWVKLTFAAMNLKKLASWMWRDTHPLCYFRIHVSYT